VPDKDKALANLPSFEVHDELYTDLLIESGAQVLAHGHSAAMPTLQPIVWSHTVGAGRVIYDALGHDSKSLHHPSHAQLLRESVKWALGEADPQ
jgi:type 1 glutamine amidotransferase